MSAYAAIMYPLRRGRILAVSRKDTGILAAVGGKLEEHDGGSPREAALRETLEEVGLDLRSCEPLQVYAGFYQRKLVVAYACHVPQHMEPVAVEPGTRIGWVWPSVIAQGFGGPFHRRALLEAGFLR